MSAPRYIFRCRSRRCDAVWAYEYPELLDARIDAEGRRRFVFDDQVCPKCGALYAQANRVRGHFSELRDCDARCTDAVGHQCNCSCGGANHGAGHVGAWDRIKADPDQKARQEC